MSVYIPVDLQREIRAQWSADASEIVGLTATGRATVAALHMNRSQMVRVRRMWRVLGEHPPRIDRAQ